MTATPAGPTQQLRHRLVSRTTRGAACMHARPGVCDMTAVACRQRESKTFPIEIEYDDSPALSCHTAVSTYIMAHPRAHAVRPYTAGSPCFCLPHHRAHAHDTGHMCQIYTFQQRCTHGAPVMDLLPHNTPASPAQVFNNTSAENLCWE
jgi:hypothetical protein